MSSKSHIEPRILGEGLLFKPQLVASFVVALSIVTFKNSCRTILMVSLNGIVRISSVDNIC